MYNNNDNISDDEIRILGGQTDASVPDYENDSRRSNHPWKKYSIIGLLLLLIIGIVIALFAFLHKKGDSSLNNQMTEDPKTSSTVTANVESSNNACIINKDTIINDIPLHILEPKNCRMKLQVGYLEDSDNILLALPAADVRSDKDLPAGAFVIDGNLISKGHSKYGFCAIINDQVTIGRQLETVLFERSIEENGSFFRQYSLVSNCQLMDIPPKGKNYRRAMCYLNGTIQVVITQDKESFHDFSQALVDLGVTEAIALVGGDAYIKYMDNAGSVVSQGETIPDKPNSINYLIWTK